ncbi:ASKHA domain-containing protein [Chloroflexota bacterium]
MKANKYQNQKGEEKKRSSSLSPSGKRRVKHVWLNVKPDNIWLRVRQGETVWGAMQKTDIELAGDCGGLGKCGKCKVKILSEIDAPSSEEREFLDEEELKQGIRLACRTKVNNDLVISTKETDTEAEYYKVLTTSHVMVNSYIPISQLEPLVDKRLITLSPDIKNKGLSDLDQIKLAMGPEYQDLSASLHCLRTLTQRLQESHFQGAAVLHGKYLIALQNRREVQRHYGLAFDLGTSTLVGKLISLVDGSEFAVASCLNSQSKYGSDVISRLQYVKEHPRGLGTLQRLLIKDLNQLTRQLLKTGGFEASNIFIVVAAGNTTMQHFLLNLPPLGIAEAPFSPVVTDGLVVKATDAGLQLHAEALLYTMPMKAAYIGGDLISVVLASGVTEQKDEIILGLDLGTNGEIFLGNGKRLLTCSAAAGPALEGARISSGMIAKAGAIEGVNFEEGRLSYRVIGNVKPKGLCGSGLVDLVAVLLNCGIIDFEGLIRPPSGKVTMNLSSRVINRSGGYDFLIASPEESYDQRPIFLTQKDVRELQLAKGAIAAGVKTLMDELGIRVQDIDRVYLAGALGNYVAPHSAIRAGLLPRVNAEIIRSLGNAASLGASMALLSSKHWQMAKDIAAFIEHIELSSRPDFNQYFIEHMDFPGDNPW